VVLTLSVCVYTAALCLVEFCGCVVILVFRPLCLQLPICFIVLQSGLGFVQNIEKSAFWDEVGACARTWTSFRTWIAPGLFLDLRCFNK